MKKLSWTIAALTVITLCLGQRTEMTEEEKSARIAAQVLAREHLQEVLDAVMPMSDALCVYREEGCQFELVPEMYFTIGQGQDRRLVAVLIRPANFSVYTDLVKAYRRSDSLTIEAAVSSVAVVRKEFTEQETPSLREWYTELLALSIPIKPKDTVLLDGPDIRLRLHRGAEDISFRTGYTDHPLVCWARKVHRQLTQLADTKEGKHNQ